MHILKNILIYLLWTVTALFLGVIYMCLILGNLPNDESFGGFGFVLKVFYLYGIALIGLPIGGIIAFLFIITDVLYLKKRLKSNPKRTHIRFGILLAITICTAVVHYLLEKVIDII